MNEQKPNEVTSSKEVGKVTAVEARSITPVPELTPMERGEIESQIATAKRYPRSVSKFQTDCMSLATTDKDIAAACFYVIPRAGSFIEGPSVRLAEIALSSWGNAVAQAFVTHEDHNYVYATGMCRDLEKNVAFRITSRRRIVDRNGKRYNADMIAVTANAAASIALRQAIFKVIPAALTNEIYKKCKEVAVGDVKSLSVRRKGTFEYLQKFGTTQERILAALGKKSIEDVDLEDLGRLIGFANSLKNNEAGIDTVFPEIKKPDDKPAAKVGDVKPDLPFDDGGVKQKCNLFES